MVYCLSELILECFGWVRGGNLEVVLSIKSRILASYCCIGSKTMEFPLSAEAIIASLCLGFAFINFNVLDSVCVLLRGFELLGSFSIRSATCFL